METGDYHNPMLLKLEEYSVREAPDSRTAAAAVNDGKLQWMFRYSSTVSSTAIAKRSPSSERMLSYHDRTSSKSSFASGVHTIGSVTAS
jgi:hypothetical protein